MRHITGLSRIIDLRYPSNRLAVLVTMAAGSVGLAAGEQRISAATSMAGAAFLGWAIAREIDPDRPITASIVAPVAAVVAWIDLEQGHAPVVGALYLTLVAARILVRTTGRPPTNLDLIVQLGIVGWLSAVSIAWIAGVALAVAVVLDTRVDPPAPPVNLWWGALLGVVSSLAAGVLWAPPNWVAPATREWVPMVIGLTGSVFLLRPEIPRSMPDHGSGPINPRRLVAGRITVVTTAVLTAVIGGASGVAALSPAWAALAVAGVARILSQPD